MASRDAKRKMVIYEQPLNERVRTLLRLEFLYAEAQMAISGNSEWHSRRAVDSLIEILAVLSRGDLRTELVKELERLTITLQRLDGDPGVAQERLHAILSECQRLGEGLRAARGQPGIELKSDELLNSIVQRSGVAGGTCGFDLPAYQHWLQKPAEERRARLIQWFSTLDYLREAGQLLLTSLRDSTTLRPQQALRGVYQRNLERDVSYQLIRVALPADSPYFPEISGSKLFFTVRFLTQQDTSERPTKTDDDIEFRLACCVI